MKKNFETEFCLGDGIGENYQRSEDEIEVEAGCLGDGIGENQNFCENTAEDDEQKLRSKIAIKFGEIAGDWCSEKIVCGESYNVLMKSCVKAVHEENYNQLFKNIMNEAAYVGEIDKDTKEEFIDLLEFFLKREKRINNKTISEETKIVEMWS